ncbi:hypothetical protein BH09GEM1_BH09GEM1_14770 [soil metagenome]
MIHPDTALRPADARVGFGVFATRAIPRGTISWVHDALDQTFTPDEVAHLAPLHRAAMRRFAYREPSGVHVLCWDHARYSNHACRPSCRTIGDFDIVVRDIDAGDELTIEYAVVNVQAAFTCACGDPHCRGTVSGADADRYAEAWDAEARDAALAIAQVSQPLAALFPGSPLLVRAMSGADILLPSCRDLVLRC